MSAECIQTYQLIYITSQSTNHRRPKSWHWQSARTDALASVSRQHPESTALQVHTYEQIQSSLSPSADYWTLFPPKKKRKTLQFKTVWNDRIALSVNACGKSFHIDSKAVFSSAMLVGLAYIASQYCTPDMIIQWIEIPRLKYQRGYF